PRGWAAIGKLPLQTLKVTTPHDRPTCPPAACRAVAGLPALTSLTLAAPQGAAELAKAPRLSTLTLEGAGVTDAVVAPLKGAGGLRSLNLAKTAVTEAGVKDLAAALPLCRIQWP